MSLLDKLRAFRLPAFDRGDHAADSRVHVENPDALAATGGRSASDSSNVTGHAGAPPGYVKQDDGRPRH
jgi:hypothetical protein